VPGLPIVPKCYCYEPPPNFDEPPFSFKALFSYSNSAIFFLRDAGSFIFKSLLRKDPTDPIPSPPEDKPPTALDPLKAMPAPI
jgi:hypothetical protein